MKDCLLVESSQLLRKGKRDTRRFKSSISQTDSYCLQVEERTRKELRMRRLPLSHGELQTYSKKARLSQEEAAC